MCGEAWEEVGWGGAGEEGGVRRTQSIWDGIGCGMGRREDRREVGLGRIFPGRANRIDE